MPFEFAAEFFLPEIIGAFGGAEIAGTIGAEALAGGAGLDALGAGAIASTLGPEVLAGAPELGVASGVAQGVAQGLTPEAAAVSGAAAAPVPAPSFDAGSGSWRNILSAPGGTENAGSGLKAVTSTSPSLSGPVGSSVPAASGIGAPTGAPGGTGGIADFLKANKNLILPGAAFGASMLSKPDAPDMSSLKDIAGRLSGPGAASKAANDLIPTVSTGTLPPAAEAQVSSALNDATQAIKSKYASLGLSGSTMETQELNAASERAAAQRFTMANQLTQTGLAAAGVSGSELASSASIYNAIMNTQLQQDEELQKALASFASASALGGGLQSLKAA